MSEPHEFLDAICRSALEVSMADDEIKGLLDDLAADGANEGRLMLLLQRLWYLAATSATASLRTVEDHLHDTRRDCVVIVDGKTATRERLVAEGMTPSDANKVIAFRDRLLATQRCPACGEVWENERPKYHNCHIGKRIAPLTLDEMREIERKGQEATLIVKLWLAIVAAQEVIGQCDCIMHESPNQDPKRKWFSSRDEAEVALRELRRARGAPAKEG